MRPLLPVVALFLASTPILAQDSEVRFQSVAENVYVFVGEIGPRTYENGGLNANFGLIVTSDGAILIDSGAASWSAQKLHAAIGRVTKQPVRWVINTGGQDHRWFGNGYFKQQGAQVIAHANARADMLARGRDQLEALRPVLKERVEGTELVAPDRWIEGDDARLELGGVALEFRHRGGAHTPGDMMVWLPATQLIFSGDAVYVDRLLAVTPSSNTRNWLATFGALEQLSPARIVPGHGQVSTLATARADTEAYLDTLRGHMKKAVDDGVDISGAIRSFDATPFMRLANAAELHPGNASRTYLEVERE